MTREEAIKEAYGIPVTKAQHEALQFLIPELRDSEDERIRKKLLEYFTARKSEEGDIDEEWYGLSYEEIIAYLEKQKEQTEELSTRLNGLMQEYVHAGKDEEEQEHRLKCYQLFWDALGDSEFFEQKEQKSREDIINETVKDKAFTIKLLKSAGILDETGELAEMYRSGQDSTECIPDSVKFDEGFKTGREVGFREGVESSKFAEWSEEDDYRIRWIISLLTTMREKGIDDRFGDSVPDDIPDMIAWLKSLPERFNLQPKQEWGEEDNFMATTVENSFYLHCGQMTDRLSEQYKKFFEKVKSLRPKPHWKPSEEQMKALEYGMDDIRFCKLGKERLPILQSLYNDLQKLL